MPNAGTWGERKCEERRYQRSQLFVIPSRNTKSLFVVQNHAMQGSGECMLPKRASVAACTKLQIIPKWASKASFECKRKLFSFDLHLKGMWQRIGSSRGIIAWEMPYVSNDRHAQGRHMGGEKVRGNAVPAFSIIRESISQHQEPVCCAKTCNARLWRVHVPSYRKRPQLRHELSYR